jgi:transposase
MRARTTAAVTVAGSHQSAVGHLGAAVHLVPQTHTFLRERRVPPGGWDAHKTPSINAWFARHPRFHVHFTPTSASWLNQVERWFATLTEKCILRGTHRSTRQLEQAIRQYLQVNNDSPKPFFWANTADEILSSIERFCLRISNSKY